jgi:hypothetical protein
VKNTVDDVPVLSIGVVAGGTMPPARAWDAVAADLMRRLSAIRANVTSPLHVNVVYDIPGEVFSPDFVGVRSGRYSSKARHLLVQAAVPREVPQNPRSVLIKLLEEAIDEAARFARGKAIADDLPELRDLVSRLARQVTNEPTG